MISTLKSMICSFWPDQFVTTVSSENVWPIMFQPISQHLVMLPFKPFIHQACLAGKENMLQAGWSLTHCTADSHGHFLASANQNSQRNVKRWDGAVPCFTPHANVHTTPVSSFIMSSFTVALQSGMPFLLPHPDLTLHSGLVKAPVQAQLVHCLNNTAWWKCSSAVPRCPADSALCPDGNIPGECASHCGHLALGADLAPATVYAKAVFNVNNKWNWLSLKALIQGRFSK